MYHLCILYYILRKLCTKIYMALLGYELIMRWLHLMRRNIVPPNHHCLSISLQRRMFLPTISPAAHTPIHTNNFTSSTHTHTSSTTLKCTYCKWCLARFHPLSLSSFWVHQKNITGLRDYEMIKKEKGLLSLKNPKRPRYPCTHCFSLSLFLRLLLIKNLPATLSKA